MCKTTIEIELKKVFMEQDCFKKECIFLFKEKFSSNNKQLKRLILSSFMNNILKNKSLALFDENIFNIYKAIIDNYKVFLNQVKDINFKFNDKVLQNLSGIASVLKSQVNFFCEGNTADINPIYTEKKNIITKYVDNIYKDIDNIQEDNFEDVDILDIKKYFIDKTKKTIKLSYKTNLLNCFNAINDIENRKEVNFFNDALEEEREILASIIKLQIKALEELCKNDDEKNTIDIILNPIIEVYQQTCKSFDMLSKEIKTMDININISFKEDEEKIDEFILKTFNDIDNKEDVFKQKAFDIFKKYISSLKETTILNEQNNIALAKDNIQKYLMLSNDIKDSFYMIAKYIKDNNNFLMILKIAFI